jgi:pyrroline-5-carboxylate reductase
MFEGAQPLLLVGAGKMGGAMLGRWLELGLDARQVTVLDPYLDKDHKKDLLRKHARVAVDAAEAGEANYRVVVLAVKPQSIDDALSAIASLVGSETAVVSIAAGVRLARLLHAFADRQPVIRAMPNTPAQIGSGVTVAIANAYVSPPQRSTVDALLAAVGKTAWVDDEGLIDAVTAVSGSGPAYVFLLAECLAEAARKAGLPQDLADMLARETVAGAGALLAANPLDLAILRKNVTSPGGTTAAALSILMAEDGLQKLLTRAVEAARKRSIELG